MYASKHEFWVIIKKNSVSKLLFRFIVLTYMWLNNSIVDKQFLLLHQSSQKKNSHKHIPKFHYGKSGHPLLCQFLLQQGEPLLLCNQFVLWNEVKLRKSWHLACLKVTMKQSFWHTAYQQLSIMHCCCITPRPCWII